MRLPKSAFGLILFLYLSVNVSAQSAFYAASKSGLNLREQPNPNAAVLSKIPYGAKVTKAADAGGGELVTEGMNTQWVRVLYEGRPGYVADVYLLPFAPPATPGDFSAYLQKLSPQTGSSKKVLVNGVEGEVSITRSLHQNGMAYRHFSGYEYYAETIWIPSLTLQQAFVLARLLSPEAALLSTADPFPDKSSTGTESSHSIVLHRPYPGNDWIGAIHYEWCEGGCYNLQISYEEGEVSITLSNGV